MKKTISAAIGNTNFIVDEDAYARLEDYIRAFGGKLSAGMGNNEVLCDLENRIAELLQASLVGNNRVVTLTMANDVISTIGMPDGSSFCAGGYSEGGPCNAGATGSTIDGRAPRGYGEGATHKLFRDIDRRSIAGVCSGLAAYFNIDLTLIRVLLIVLTLCATIGFWFYIFAWIIVPAAKTPLEKCQLRGIEPTYENLSKFTNCQ